MTSRAQRLFESMPESGSIESLGFLIEKIREVFSVEHVAYIAMSLGRSYALSSSERAQGLLARNVGFWQKEAGALVAVTYDKSWGERYAEAEYSRIDPVLEETTRSFAPFNWRSLSWDTKKRRQFLHEAVECGLGNQGYTIPIRGPDGQFALFVINNTCSDDEWVRFIAECKSDLLVISHFFHQKVLEIESVTVAPNASPLSTREVDVLTAISMGKNRSQIAYDLKISENTLRVYIDSARHKLGALNIPHAVAIGIHRGIINI